MGGLGSLDGHSIDRDAINRRQAAISCHATPCKPRVSLRVGGREGGEGDGRDRKGGEVRVIPPRSLESRRSACTKYSREFVTSCQHNTRKRRTEDIYGGCKRCMRPDLSDGLLLGFCELLPLRAGHGAHPMRWNAVRNAAAGRQDASKINKTDHTRRQQKRKEKTRRQRDTNVRKRKQDNKITENNNAARKTRQEEQFKQDKTVIHALCVPSHRTYRHTILVPKYSNLLYNKVEYKRHLYVGTK